MLRPDSDLDDRITLFAERRSAGRAPACYDLIRLGLYVHDCLDAYAEGTPEHAWITALHHAARVLP